MPINLDLKVSLFAILLVAVAAFVLLSGVLCSHPHGDFDMLRVYAWLKGQGYTMASEAKEHKPDNILPEIKETATATGYGTSTWIPEQTYSPGDSIPVELSTIELPDGTWWARLTIDGKPIAWDRLEFHREVPAQRWSVFMEVINCDRSQNGNDLSQNGDSSPQLGDILGFGVGYNLFTVAKVNAVPSVAVGYRADWIAPELRLTRNVLGGVSVGAGAGYRFGADEGVHLSVGIGIDL